MMTNMVRFRAGDGEYAVAVTDTREVRRVTGLVPMPSPGPGVVGMLASDTEALTVTSLLGTSGDHVLVLDAGTGPVGLLVEEVLGVFAIDLATVGPPPTGQQGHVVSGSIVGPEGLTFVLDARAIAQELVA